MRQFTLPWSRGAAHFFHGRALDPGRKQVLIACANDRSHRATKAAPRPVVGGGGGGGGGVWGVGGGGGGCGGVVGGGVGIFCPALLPIPFLSRFSLPGLNGGHRS